MKDIQQLIKRDNQEGKYKDIFPQTYIEAISDKQTGVGLDQILNSFNMYFLSYQGNAQSTRLQVIDKLRRQGLWITYVTFDNKVIIEWYNSTDLSNTAWANSSNWMQGNNMLVGDITISSNGTWVINGEDTGIPARGEQGITPILRVGSNNHLQASYTNGSSWVDVSTNPVYTQFRINNNKLEQSVDLGQTWTVVSDYIASWFRFTGTTGSSQADNVGKIQISRDNGVTWSDLSGEFTNSLYIKGYVSTIATLPSSAVQGDIYGVGPTYDPSDTEQTNPIYQLYVKDSTGWVNNGRFTSISAGVVQEKGTSTTEVMSQDAVTRELTELESVAGNEVEVATATNETISITYQCRVNELIKVGTPLSIKVVDTNNCIAEARLRIWDLNDNQSWMGIPSINEWVTIIPTQDIKAYSVYAASTTGNVGDISILKRGNFYAIAEEVSQHDDALKDIIDFTGIANFPIEINVGKYYTLNEHNEVILIDHKDYVYSESLVERGLYNIFAWARSGASVIVQGVSGKIYYAFSGYDESTNWSVYLPESTGKIYISSHKNATPKLGRVLRNDLINQIQSARATDVIDESSFTRGGYFGGQTTTIQPGNGWYIERVPIKGYKSIDVIFESVSTASWRESMITDADGKVTQWGYEMNANALHFDVNFGDEYLYVSTSMPTICVLLNKAKSESTFVNPLEGLKDRPNFHISIFNKITCIGDSLTQGVFNTTGNDIVDTRYSYPTFLEKQTGVETKNLGIGSTCASRADLNHSWFDVANSYGYFKEENIGDCCIVALGTNDISRFGEFTGDVSTDIGNTIESCANTSVGGYAAIVLKMKELQPKMKFFFVTISNNRNQVSERTPANEKIRQLAEYFGAYVIDLERWAENTITEQAAFTYKYKNGSHNNALGYNLRAKQYAVAMSYLIEHNWKDFLDVQFIGSDYQYEG